MSTHDRACRAARLIDAVLSPSTADPETIANLLVTEDK